MSTVPFRQGIVRYDPTGLNSSFFTVSGSNATLIASTTNPFTAAFAHGPTNYLVTFVQDIPNAWTGLPNAIIWLYIDINPVTANITYGYTTLAPVYGASAPVSPVDGQLWFNTTNATMYVRQSGLWVEKIRLVVAKLTNLGTAESVSDQYPQFDGTTVANNTVTPTGFILFDAATGNPVRRLDGAYTVFVTTEDRLATQDPSGASVKLASVIVEAVATQPLNAYTVVRFSDFNEITYANEFTSTIQPFGLIEETTSTGDTVRVVMEGVIFNPSWSWPTINGLLYSDPTGALTTVVPITNPNAAPVAIVIDPNTILMRAPELTVTNISATNPPDASTTVKGISKLSVPPVSATDPIAVGDNDARLVLASTSLQKDGSVAMTGDLDMGGNYIVNLADGVNPTDAINLSQLNSAISSITFNYLSPKDPVRVASTTSVNLSAPGSAIDGIALVLNDRVLIKDGSTTNPGTASIDNGIYVWYGAGVPMTRAADADTSAEVVTGMYVLVTAGTQAGHGYILETPAPITLGTTPLTFVYYSTNVSYTAGTGIQIISNIISIDATLDDLNNVAVATPTTGDVLTWNGATWISQAPTVGAINLNDLGDVTIASPIDGQTLVYQSGVWINSSSALAGSVSTLSDVDLTGIADRDLLVYNLTAQTWYSTPLAELGIAIDSFPAAYVPTIGGPGSIAIGQSAVSGYDGSVLYDYALAVGYGAKAAAYSGVALGYYAGVAAAYGIAIGDNASGTASAERSISIGHGAKVNTTSSLIGFASIAIGDMSVANADNATVLGNNLTNATPNSIMLGQRINTGIDSGTIIVPGSGYVDGYYPGVPLTGGSGISATANITVVGGVVTIVTLVNRGVGYTVNDTLSADNANLGGSGSGFQYTVSALRAVTVGTQTLYMHLYQHGRLYLNGTNAMYQLPLYSTTDLTTRAVTPPYASEPDIRGAIAYDSTLDLPKFFNGTAWVPFSSIGSLNDLTDVTVTGPSLDEILYYNGTQWVNGSLTTPLSVISIDALSDVDTTTTPPSVGNSLVWDGTNWVPGALILNDLADVTITPPLAPVGGQFLYYDGGTTQWINRTFAETYPIDAMSDVDTTSTPPSIDQFLKFDGVNWIPGTLTAADLPVLQVYDVSGSALGTPSADQVVLHFVAVRDFDIPANMFGSKAYVQTTASLGTWNFDVRLNGVSFNTLSFAVGNNAGTFGTSSAQAITAGDVITIIAPAPPDATLADLTVSIKGSTTDVLGLFDLPASTPGIPAASLYVMNYVCARDLQIQASFTGAQAKALQGATALATFDIRNNGNSFGTIDFPADTVVAYPITAVTIGAGGTFTIAGIHAAEFVAGYNFQITGSTGNDGFWTVASATDGGVGPTVITVLSSQTIPDGTADGNIVAIFDNVGSFAVTNPTYLNFAAGDVLTIVAPGTPDATLADIAITIKAAAL